MPQIIIDLSWMRIGKVGGAEQATYNLIHGLSHIDSRNRYSLKCPRATFWDWKFPPNFKHRVSFSDRIQKERIFRRQMLWNGPDSKNKLSISSDLLHAPSGYLPAKINSSKLVVTIHDLQHLAFPQYFTEDERKYRDSQLESIVRRADQIICISDFTKKCLITKFRIRESRVNVIWQAPDMQMSQKIETSHRKKGLQRLGIRAPFFIYPSYPWKHKNHTRLLAAWENLTACREVQKRTLVLTGAPLRKDHAAFPILQRLIAKNRVLHLGYRDPSEMRILFQSAEALIFPSEYEGFGLPIAEAFHAGLPVVTSNAGSLPEIGGDAAHYFDPNSIEAIERAIFTIANQPDLRQALAEKGRERSHLFSPLRCAASTLQVYAKALKLEPSTIDDPADEKNFVKEPPINGSRFEYFRKFSRRSEQAARVQSWILMVFFALLAFLVAPIRASKRLALGALCHLEVFAFRLVQKSKFEQD
jgi:alpha-1,3-rhamnosyl/mannosyltransferase